MTSTLPTLEIFMDGLLGGEPWLYDPVVAPLPWRHDLAAKPTRPLKIGYYLDDGIVRIQPPHEAAVRRAIRVLQNASHDGMPSPCRLQAMLSLS